MPVTTISAVPKHISKEEHGQLTAATPSSFADIPPVLRHKQEHVRAVFDLAAAIGIAAAAVRVSLSVVVAASATSAASSLSTFAVASPSALPTPTAVGPTPGTHIQHPRTGWDNNCAGLDVQA